MKTLCYLILTTLFATILPTAGVFALLVPIMLFAAGPVIGTVLVIGGVYVIYNVISRWSNDPNRIPWQRTVHDPFVRILPFFLPLLYCLVLVAIGFYYAPETNQETMARLMYRGMPQYFPFNALHANQPEYMGSVTPERWIFFPLAGCILATLVGAIYVFCTTPAVKYRASNIISTITLLALCLALGATSWTLRNKYREIQLVKDRDVKTVRDEDGNPYPSSDITDLEMYHPFSKSNELQRIAVPDIGIDSDYPKIHGAYALYPLYAAAVDAIYSGMDYDTVEKYVKGGTSPAAIESLLSGESDMIFMLRPSNEQLRQAEQAGKKLDITPIGREAFVFFVSKTNPVKNLSSEQIRDVYSKKITNWNELGGENRKILPFQRPEGSGSQTAMIRFMAGTPLGEPMREEVQVTMMAILNRVADYRNYGNSIGYSFRYYVEGMTTHDGVKVIGVDGIVPTIETIADGSYPVEGELVVVTAGSENPNVRKLIDWFLSPQGQNLVRRVGYVPLETEENRRPVNNE